MFQCEIRPGPKGRWGFWGMHDPALGEFDKDKVLDQSQLGWIFFAERFETIEAAKHFAWCTGEDGINNLDPASIVRVIDEDGNVVDQVLLEDTKTDAPEVPTPCLCTTCFGAGFRGDNGAVLHGLDEGEG